MNANEKSRKVKTHILFLSLFLLVLLCEFGLSLQRGSGIRTALWLSITAFRPLEAALFFAFWYSALTGNWNEGLKSNLTLLDLTKK